MLSSGAEVLPLRAPHRVTLRYPGGSLRRGRMRFFFHDQVSADFEPLDGPPERVVLSDLEAVYFVEEWVPSRPASSATSSRLSSTEGASLLRVRFADGSEIVGRAREYDPREKGFWLRPIDVPACRMVFIPRRTAAAITEIRAPGAPDPDRTTNP